MQGDVTRNAIRRGRLLISQPRHGYRFNVDSVILAGFACPPEPRVCDLGTGTGILGLWLALEGAEHVVGLELQPELAELARANAEDNDLADRFEVVRDDLRLFGSGSRSASFNQVVSNPPFAPFGKGRVDSNRQRALAKHEIAMELDDLMAAAARLLMTGGRLDLIHRADREGELLESAEKHGLSPVRLRRVVPHPRRPPARILLRAVLEDPAMADAPVVEPDLVVHDSDGGYAEEVARLLDGP